VVVEGESLNVRDGQLEVFGQSVVVLAELGVGVSEFLVSGRRGIRG
jgi:hypothetical protein